MCDVPGVGAGRRLGKLPKQGNGGNVHEQHSTHITAPPRQLPKQLYLAYYWRIGNVVKLS